MEDPEARTWSLEITPAETVPMRPFRPPQPTFSNSKEGASPDPLPGRGTHGTVKLRPFWAQFNDDAITSAEWWNQPEGAAWQCRCCQAVASWTDWIGPQGASWSLCLMTNPPGPPEPLSTNRPGRARLTAAWSRPPAPAHSCTIK